MSLLENISTKLLNKFGPFKLFVCILILILFIFFALLLPKLFEYQNMTQETMNRIKTADAQAGDK